MPRQARIVVPGAVHQVTQRGNQRRQMFFDEADYLLYNGVLGDKRPEGGNVLTNGVLEGLPEHDGPKVIYGEGSRLRADRLRREGIVFKQVPYGIKVS